MGFKALLKLGANPNVLFDDGGTVMHWAARMDSTEFLQAALEHGGDPNLRGGRLKALRYSKQSDFLQK